MYKQGDLKTSEKDTEIIDMYDSRAGIQKAYPHPCAYLYYTKHTHFFIGSRQAVIDLKDDLIQWLRDNPEEVKS